MKTFIVLSAALVLTGLSACGSNSDTSKENKENTVTRMDTAGTQPPANSVAASISEVLMAYLELKNALASDNAKQAATAGNALAAATTRISTATLLPEQSKVYEEVREDMKEHGEHIGANAGKIAHQREHFEMLSKDMYDLVKAFGAGQTLYRDFCPMYNDNKGVYWLSEVKEIKNPYLGKEMPTCGEVKEEIKQ